VGHVKLLQLLEITVNPAHVYMVNDFDALQAFVNDLTINICANSSLVWQQLDKDLSVILEHSLRSQVETKLNAIGDILYEECRGRFGVKAEKRSSGPKQKGRRKREMEQLVKRRLQKQWRTASEEEREGLKPLWEEVKKSLASLQRAERIRKRRRRKEKERSNFFKNTFKDARQLLEDKRSGKLEISRSELEIHIREQYSDPAKLVVSIGLNCKLIQDDSILKDPAHQGNYSCVYGVYVFSHNFSSESRLLSLTVTGPDEKSSDKTPCRTGSIIPPVVLLVALLLVVIIIYFILKASRGLKSDSQVDTEMDYYDLGVSRAEGEPAEEEEAQGALTAVGHHQHQRSKTGSSETFIEPTRRRAERRSDWMIDHL
ncbi:hypothetical protein F2P79_011962, partial [Scomber scombrus]